MRRVPASGFFVAAIVLTLVAATMLVGFLLVLASDLGFVSREPIVVTSDAIVSAVLGITGLIGLTLAYQRFTSEAAATRARFVFELNQDFFSNGEERDFYYSVEHGTFEFQPETFARSKNEQHLDRILYRLGLVGKLLSDRILTTEDVSFVRHIAQTIFGDSQVAAYLHWLRAIVPDHRSFDGAVSLCNELGPDCANLPGIRAYLGKA